MQFNSLTEQTRFRCCHRQKEAIQARLDFRPLPAYTWFMIDDTTVSSRTPCLCHALRKASRTVSRLYDDELRKVGLRTTQFSMLMYLSRVGEVRQRDLGDLMFLEETTVTRNLRPLLNNQWVTVRAGSDRREKFVGITAAGIAKLKEGGPIWIGAQRKMKSLLRDEIWQQLLAILPEVNQAVVKE